MIEIYHNFVYNANYGLYYEYTSYKNEINEVNFCYWIFIDRF